MPICNRVGAVFASPGWRTTVTQGGDLLVAPPDGGTAEIVGSSA